MKRQNHDPTRSRRDHARRHPGRVETLRAVYEPASRGPCGRVSGALAASTPGGEQPFAKDSVVAAEIIGESHTGGLSVLWSVLCEHWRSSPPR
jgi:hypothetical protein